MKTLHKDTGSGKYSTLAVSAIFLVLSMLIVLFSAAPQHTSIPKEGLLAEGMLASVKKVEDKAGMYTSPLSPIFVLHMIDRSSSL